MRRTGRILDLAIAALSLSAAIWSFMVIRPSAFLAGGCLVLAVAWGALPFVVDALFGGGGDADDGGPADDTSATVTTIVCVGVEPEEVARASIVLAAQTGPTFVAAVSRPAYFTDLEHTGVELAIAATMRDAVQAAVANVVTDAVLLVSASAFPVPGVARVAGRLHGDVAWAVGGVAACNDDAYGPRIRALAAARQRARSRAAGLVAWEPDAVVVRTDALRTIALDDGAPRGAWLRTLAARGYRGIETSELVARRAVPTDGPSFWPSEAMRRRAAAADLADGLGSGPPRARILAAAGLARELYAFQLLCWLASPIAIGWSGAFPLRSSAIVFFAVHCALAGARWTSTRRGLGLRPAADARSTIYDIPGSLLAFSSAVTRRVRPPRLHIPEQPLVVAAIVGTIAFTLPLLDRPPTGDSGVDGTVALAIVSLVALWIAAVHAIGPGGRIRASYRLRVAATVDWRDGRLIDASPAGVAIAGPYNDVSVGDSASLVFTFVESGARVAIDGTVVSRRGDADEVILGIGLAHDPAARAEWIRRIVEAPLVSAARAGRARASRRARLVVTETRTQVFLRRAQLSAVGAVSMAAVGLLVVMLVGYRPLVVRSGSMVPAFQVGDVAIVDWVRASELEVGDVVTFTKAEVGDESVTHRVRNLHHDGTTVDVETRGDANDGSEYWTASDRELVGRVVGRIPSVGTLLSRIGTPGVRNALLGTAATIALAALAAPVVRTRRRTAPSVVGA